MFNFGEFRAQTEIGWGKFSTVYVAEARGASGQLADAAVKSVRLKCPAEGFFDGVDPEAFDSAVARQRAANETGCTGVAPILATGRNGLLAYYATKRFARSLHDLIQGKVQLNPGNLRQIATGCADALVQLRKKTGAGHGNLKASNVLCVGTGQPDGFQIVLTDLAPFAESETEDINALGLLIAQLVLRREISNAHSPIPHSPEWQALGEEGERWRAYCNALIDPAFSRSLDGLAFARDSIPKPAGKKRRSAALIALTVFVLAFAGGFGFWLFKPSPPPPPVTGQQWSAFCDDYATWFGNLCSSSAWLDKWAEDPFLNLQVVQPLRKQAAGMPLRSAFNPRTAIDPRGVNATKDLKQFDADLPTLDPKALTQTNQILAAVRIVREGVTQWPGHADLKKALAELAPEASAGEKFNEATELAWNANLGNWMSRNVDFLQSWHVLTDQSKRLGQSKNSFLESSYKATLQAAAHSQNFDELHQQIKEASQAAAKLAGFMVQTADQLDGVRLAEISQKYIGKPLKANIAEQWLLEAAGTMEKPNEWLNAITAMAVGKHSQTIQTAWKKRRDTALGSVSATALNSDRPRFRALKTRLERLSRALSALDEEFPPANVAQTPGTPTPEPLALALQAAAETSREQAIASILKLLPSDELANDDSLLTYPGAAAQKEDFTATLAYIAHVPVLLDKLQTLYAQGASLDEGLAATADEVQKGAAGTAALQPLLELTEIKQALAPVAELKTLLTAEAPVLQQKIASANLSIALTSLAQLHVLSKAQTAADWQKFKGWTDTVTAKLKAGIVPPVRRNELEQRAAALIREQWFSAFRNYEPEQMQQLLGLKEAAQISDTLLSGRDRYNILILNIHATLPQGQISDPSALRAQFLNSVQAIADLSAADKASIAPLVDELNKLTFNNQTETAVKTRGPGRQGWQSDPQRVGTFHWGQHAVSFVRLLHADGTPFYLAETAVPIGLVADWLKKPDVPQINLASPAQNRIPVVWVGSGRSIAPASDWFGPYYKIGTQFPEEAHYPPGFEAKAPPTAETPMVYISAESADQLARSMGFRLPTADEWQTAYEQTHAKETPASKFNLRDATWNAEQNYLKNYATTHALDGRPAQVAWLDSAIFRPDPATSTKTGRQNAQPEHSDRDGFLWFAPVGQGGECGGIHHLIGNVAQYVKANDGESFAVVGGSALSEPGPHDHPHPVPKTGLGFSDVGFRLALDGDLMESPEVTKLKAILKNVSFLKDQ